MREKIIQTVAYIFVLFITNGILYYFIDYLNIFKFDNKDISKLLFGLCVLSIINKKE